MFLVLELVLGKYILASDAVAPSVAITSMKVNGLAHKNASVYNRITGWN
jgi:hypothetical protein